MADIIGSLLSGGIEGAGNGIAAVINSIRGKSPEDAAKLAQLQADAMALKAKYASDFDLAKIDENVKLNDIAGQNIRSEQNSRYSAWARPSVIYAWIGVILYNYIIAPWRGKLPATMPDMFWEVSCIVITGYVFARSGDKLLGGAGGSLQGLGLKIESKGD